MYIIHETIADNDPRFDSRAKIIGNYWHFTIREIADDSIYKDWITHEILDESVAKAYKLTGSYKGEISLPSNSTNYEEFRHASGESAGISRKFIYKLTQTDIENVVKLMKSSMRIFAKNHIVDVKILKNIESLINAVNTIEECERLLYDYFDVNSATTNGIPKNPKFKIDLHWN
jgi:hypothetical protein